MYYEYYIDKRNEQGELVKEVVSKEEYDSFVEKARLQSTFDNPEEARASFTLKNEKRREDAITADIKE